ncbi:hypothetical protein [Cellulomonas wangsupingiae]|uniref:hypothetical protein n=1 Tax=Cellulomonas wangsupingiae TaxID=2968085 RepID=UPI001D0E8DD9|nr:hypothetical protein [Cellulomonas wangsupingiae]MCM0638966.1 hypothetical protein [Cellulomonas wangsupingiae]
MKKQTLTIEGAGDFCARSSYRPMQAEWNDPEADFEAELFAALAEESHTLATS